MKDYNYFRLLSKQYQAAHAASLQALQAYNSANKLYQDWRHPKVQKAREEYYAACAARQAVFVYISNFHHGRG